MVEFLRDPPPRIETLVFGSVGENPQIKEAYIQIPSWGSRLSFSGQSHNFIGQKMLGRPIDLSAVKSRGEIDLEKFSFCCGPGLPRIIDVAELVVIRENTFVPKGIHYEPSEIYHAYSLERGSAGFAKVRDALVLAEQIFRNPRDSEVYLKHIGRVSF